MVLEYARSCSAKGLVGEKNTKACIVYHRGKQERNAEPQRMACKVTGVKGGVDFKGLHARLGPTERRKKVYGRRLKKVRKRGEGPEA